MKNINVLVKTQKQQLCYCPDGVMGKLSAFQAMPTACADLIPIRAIVFLFLNFFSQQVNARKDCLHILGAFKDEQDSRRVNQYLSYL